MPLNRTENQFREIRRLNQADMVASVVLKAREYVASHPKHTSAWLQLADALYAMARYPEAVRALQRAAAVCPNDQLHIVYGRFGQVYEQKGSFAPAERWFRKAVKACPDEANGYIYLGALLAVGGRLREAEKIHRRGTRCRRGCRDEAHANLGLVLRALGRLPEARKCFQRALKLNPKYEMARKALADVEYAIQHSRKH